jgi:hypothetical protein
LRQTANSLFAIAAVAAAALSAPPACAEEMKMSGAAVVPTPGGLTGQTTLTRYPNTPKAHILKEGYHDVTLSPTFGLAYIEGIAERTEFGWALGGNHVYFPGAVPANPPPIPGFSARVLLKHLLFGGDSAGLAVAASAGAAGMFSGAGPTLPFDVALPFSWDFGPKNGMTLAPIAFGASHQGQVAAGGMVAFAYEWKLMHDHSFLLLDEVLLMPTFDNRLSIAWRGSLGNERLLATTGLARLSGPATALEYGLIRPELSWVGEP